MNETYISPYTGLLLPVDTLPIEERPTVKQPAVVGAKITRELPTTRILREDMAARERLNEAWQAPTIAPDRYARPVTPAWDEMIATFFNHRHTSKESEITE